MDKKRLQKLAGVPITEAAKKCKCGCDPKTCGCSTDCKCGCNAVTEMHHEQNEYEENQESTFSTMTKESFKDIGKAIGGAYDRALGDIKQAGPASTSVTEQEEAFKLVSRQCDDVLRRLERQVLGNE